MYVVMGDIHGDIEGLESALDFIGHDQKIGHVLFTGDFFGIIPGEEIPDVTVERERQYAEMEHLIRRFCKDTQKTFLAVPGNYDVFGDSFEIFNLHHKDYVVCGSKIYGHGGSYVPPSDPRVKEFTDQDFNRELELLIESDPEIIISHSPLRRYVNYFLERSGNRTLFYFGGHTHVYQYFRLKIDDNAVYIIRPGAIGKTMKWNSKEYLAQTFMVFDPSFPDELSLFTLKEGQFDESRVGVLQRELDEYNESEMEWESREK